MARMANPRGLIPVTFHVQQGRDFPEADKVTKMANPRCSIPVTVGPHELFTKKKKKKKQQRFPTPPGPMPRD